MTHHDARTRRSQEAGFTLIELLIVLVIIGILVVAAIVAMRGAKVSARNDSMQAAAASIDQAIGAFNRMYPVVGGAPDQLVTRGSGVWTGNTGSAANGLADETGAWLLTEWPKNPFGNAGVTVRRYATLAPCSTGVPGEVRVCRITGRPQSYEIRAWGRDKDNATLEIYRAQHGNG